MFSKIVLVPAALGALAMQAHAALPAGVDTAITAVETDGIALVGLVLARFGFKL
jgi:hypothetical protein